MKKEKGFALLELMIVVVIIGILTIIFATQYNQYKTEGSDDQAIDVLNDLATVQEFYFMDHNEYTADWPALMEYGAQSTERIELNINISTGGKDYVMEASHVDSDNTYRVTKHKAVALKQ